MTGYLHTRSDNFGKVPYELISDTSISAGAVRLYAHMHWRYGSNMKNYESRASMAEAMGVTKRTITKYITELEQANWIIVKIRTSKRGRESNFYHVFEIQEDCLKWRKEKKVAKPLRTVEKRTGRAGVGGKIAPKGNSASPSYRPQLRNSSSGTPLNSASGTPLNSSSVQEPDSRVNQTHDEPDSIVPQLIPVSYFLHATSEQLSALRTEMPQASEKPDPPVKAKKARKRSPGQKIVDAWLEATPDSVRPDNVSNLYKTRTRLGNIIAKNFTPAQVAEFVQAKYREPYWSNKFMELSTVSNQIKAHFNGHHPQGARDQSDLDHLSELQDSEEDREWLRQYKAQQLGATS
jgi:hypothetical protein